EQFFMRRVFDEQFFRKISDFCVDCASIKCYCRQDNEKGRETPFWNATPDLLPVICRFVDFSFDCFTLQPNQLIDLIVMRFGMPYVEGLRDWNIELTAKINDTHMRRLSNQFDLNMSDDGELEITRRGSDFKCTIEFSDLYCLCEWRPEIQIYNDQ
ncbi:hypothetical protein PENTCL1PPCAC_3131, partial [Pristionchus entomophagus]